MSRLYPPGPRSLIPLKLLFDFKAQPLAFMERFSKFGPVAHFSLAGQHLYLLSDPELIREVLHDTQGRFAKGRALRRAKALVGEGLLTSEPPLHTRQKRLMMPAFHRQQIAGYGQAMVAALDRQSSAWQSGQILELWSELMRLTQSIAAETLFGVRVDAEAGPLSSAINDLLEDFEVISFPGADLIRWLPVPAAFRYHRARRRLDALVYGIIRQRRAEGGAGHDLLSLLLAARDEDGGAMSDMQLRDEVMTLFLAGHETTSNALLWALRLLVENPQAEEKLRDELARELGGRVPGAEDYVRLLYTRQVLAEAMRIYPPVWTLSRQALQPLQLGGWQIPRRSILLISQWIMHRAPSLWPEPLAFKPERHDDAAKAARPAFSYFPFGAGPRGCIGEGFAWMEGVLLLARFLQHWRIESVGPLPEPQPLITLRPQGGMRVRLLPATR